jgi:hypothetical protein
MFRCYNIILRGSEAVLKLKHLVMYKIVTTETLAYTMKYPRRMLKYILHTYEVVCCLLTSRGVLWLCLQTFQCWCSLGYVPVDVAGPSCGLY